MRQAARREQRDDGADTAAVGGRDDRASGPTGTVDRVAEVLLAFAGQDGDLGVTEIAERIGVSKAAVHRVLRTLSERGLVTRDDVSHRYSVGPAVLRLASAYRGQVGERHAIAPVMRELVARVGETGAVSIRAGDHRVYVDEVRPDREVRSAVEIGSTSPLHDGAAGRAIMAALDDDELDRVVADAGFEPSTENDLRADIDHIRRVGFATSGGSSSAGTVSVAAVVRGRSGRPVAAIELRGPSERFAVDLAKAGEDVAAAVGVLSLRLGSTTAVDTTRSELPSERASRDRVDDERLVRPHTGSR